MQEEELRQVFDTLIAQHGISVEINPAPRKFDGVWALDAEHDEQGTFVGCGLSNDGRTVLYFSDTSLLRGCDFSTVSLICHNGRTDFDVLSSWGINVTSDQLVWDTEILAHFMDSSRKGYGLKSLALDCCGISYPSYDNIVGKRTEKQIKPRRTLDQWPIEIVSKYNALDVYATWKLYEYQKQRIKDTTIFTAVERPVAFILQETETRGVCVDLQYLETLKLELEAQKHPLEDRIKNELGNINLNSPKQLLGALHDKEIYPTFKGKPSTDKRALSAIAENATVQRLLQYGELETLLSSFVNPYLERKESIVHPWFNQCGTRTGRLSCSNPNLLQIPRRTENGKRVRRMFTARPGMLLGDCDFGQIEPRVMAHLSKDPVLCEMFNSGVDFHDFTAQRLGISRDRAKVLNLSVGYRATKFSVQRQLGGTLEEAQEHINSWWTMFPSLRRWQDRILYDAKRSGFCTTLLGLRIRVDGLGDGNIWKREAAERQVINNITQGSAAEIMKLGMIKIKENQKYFSPGFGILVQVYDELLMESSAMSADIVFAKHCLESAIELDVPLTVDAKIGEDWSACH